MAQPEQRRVALAERQVREPIRRQIRAGGGEKWVTRHHARGKLLPRERVEMLLDQDSPFLELSPVAAWGSDFAIGASVGVWSIRSVPTYPRNTPKGRPDAPAT